MELEAYVCSHMAHNNFKLDGEVPKTVISGKTADISQFCEPGCHERINLCCTTVSFPEDQLVLGKNLGPSLNIGPATTDKILIPKGEVVHHSMYRPLTPKDLAVPVKQGCMKAFPLMEED